MIKFYSWLSLDLALYIIFVQRLAKTLNFLNPVSSFVFIIDGLYFWISLRVSNESSSSNSSMYLVNKSVK